MYVGIDIHFKRLPNDTQVILGVLAMYKELINAVAVESIYNFADRE